MKNKEFSTIAEVRKSEQKLYNTLIFVYAVILCIVGIMSLSAIARILTVLEIINFGNDSLVVAILKLATAEPAGVYRISGSLPNRPISITLLIEPFDMISLCILFFDKIFRGI